MGITPITKTAQNVADAVKRQFGDESGAQITDTDIIRWVNEGQMEIARQTRFSKLVSTTVSVAEQDEYTLPSLQILGIDTVRYKGLPLTQRSFNDVQESLLKSSDLTDGNPTDTPVVWYEYGDSLYLFPAPKEAGDEIKLFLTVYPTPVAAVGDALSIPDTHYKTLVDYVLAQAYELDDDWAGSQIKNNQVNQSLAQLEDERAAQQYYPTITVLPEDAW